MKDVQLPDDVERGIHMLEQVLGARLPPCYRGFLHRTVGGADVMERESARGDWVCWYGHALLEERNVTYGIQSVASTLLLIGQDGDLGYFIDMVEGADAIYSVDLGALGSDEPEKVANSISELL
ncbi:SMI1/KNR4 family protein [Zymobacter palmae]|nr:SMI1/KNR4 family protein [Zymobacter palmae]